MKKLIGIALFSLLLLPMKAYAWGEEGHRIVCGVAWQRLTPDARSLVTRVLGVSDVAAFTDLCLWADRVRDERPDTYNYHFINIPAAVAGMDMGRDCPAPKRCAPWAIARYSRELADAKADPVKRRDALLFIMHFVGDLHQPLHAGRPQDLGGNRIYIDFFGDAGTAERRNNLHSVWDSQMLRRAGAQWAKTSQYLLSQISADEARQWETLDVVAWANEAYGVCEEFVYRKLPTDGRIRNSYYMPGIAYAAVQLQKGGVRLAHLINGIAAGNADVNIAGA